MIFPYLKSLSIIGTWLSKTSLFSYYDRDLLNLDKPELSENNLYNMQHLWSSSFSIFSLSPPFALWPLCSQASFSFPLLWIFETIIPYSYHHIPDLSNLYLLSSSSLSPLFFQFSGLLLLLSCCSEISKEHIANNQLAQKTAKLNTVTESRLLAFSRFLSDALLLFFFFVFHRWQISSFSFFDFPVCSLSPFGLANSFYTAQETEAEIRFRYLWMWMKMPLTALRIPDHFHSFL